MHTIIEVLQSIKASDMSPLLKSIYGSDGGHECLDVLMKYMYVARLANRIIEEVSNEIFSYKGMATVHPGTASRTPNKVTPQSTGGFSQIGGRPGANESATAAMSVLLSWHEKVVEVAGLGCIGRTMTDWRRV